VVVNDGSHDPSYQRIIDEFGDGLVYEPTPRNNGTASARNSSAGLATKEFLVFTDDDCEPPPWWLDWVSARLVGDPRIDVLVGTTRPLWNTKSFFENVQHHFGLLPRPLVYENEILFVTACVAIRRSLFVELGGFAEAVGFKRAGEDTELAVRLKRRGAEVVTDLDWYVRHELDTFRGQLKRYWHYGYVNVLSTRLTSVSRVHGHLASAKRSEHLSKVRRNFRTAMRQSETFSRSRIKRILSSAAVTAIYAAYHDGCAVAAAHVKSADDYPEFSAKDGKSSEIARARTSDTSV
jgi:GT2 family glycosyltransferase